MCYFRAQSFIWRASAHTVNRDIELADSERDDHCLVEVLFFIPEDTKDNSLVTQSKRRRAKPKLCDRKLKDPALRKQFGDWMSSFYTKEDDKIDSHLKSLTEHIAAGSELFISTIRKLRNSWVGEPTLAMTKRRCEAKKFVRSALAQLHFSEMRVFFLSWAACFPSTFMIHHSFGNFVDAHNVWTIACKAWATGSHIFGLFASETVKAVKRDKCTFLDGIAVKADSAAIQGDNKSIFKLAKNASGCKTKEVKIVQ